MACLWRSAVRSVDPYVSPRSGLGLACAGAQWGNQCCVTGKGRSAWTRSNRHRSSGQMPDAGCRGVLAVGSCHAGCVDSPTFVGMRRGLLGGLLGCMVGGLTAAHLQGELGARGPHLQRDDAPVTLPPASGH